MKQTELPICTGEDEDVNEVQHLPYVLRPHPDGQEHNRLAENLKPYCRRCDSFLEL